MNNRRYILKWGLGIGDWGLGIGDWAQSPIPNPPIPNPQSPNYIFDKNNYENNYLTKEIKYLLKNSNLFFNSPLKIIKILI